MTNKQDGTFCVACPVSLLCHTDSPYLCFCDRHKLPFTVNADGVGSSIVFNMRGRCPKSEFLRCWRNPEISRNRICACDHGNGGMRGTSSSPCAVELAVIRAVGVEKVNEEK